MGKRRIDWAALKKDYITGIPDEKGHVDFPSLYELAEKYHCSVDALNKKSAKENWTKQRQDFQDRLLEKTVNNTLEERAITARELDQLIEKTATALLSQLFDLVIAEVEKEPQKRTAYKHSRHLLELQKAARIALGLPVEATKQESTVTVSSDDVKALEDALQAISVSDLQRLIEQDEEEDDRGLYAVK